MSQSSEPDRPNYSLLRIRGISCEDIVTVDPCTGKVTLHDPDRVDEAARTFWGAVRTLFLACSPRRDLILQASKGDVAHAGDILFEPGWGGGRKDAFGGNVIVTATDPGEPPSRDPDRDHVRWSFENAMHNWNATVRPGTKVRYYPIGCEDAHIETVTRSEAWMLGDGTPVVLVSGRTGGVAISHCRVAAREE